MAQQTRARKAGGGGCAEIAVVDTLVVSVESTGSSALSVSSVLLSMSVLIIVVLHSVRYCRC